MAADPTSTDNRFIELALALLNERESGGLVRGVDREWSRYRTHFVTAPFASKPVNEVVPDDIKAWVKDLSTKIAPNTVQRCFSLLSGVFRDARKKGLIERSPAEGLRPKAPSRDSELVYLTVEEQRAIAACDKISEFDRIMILFAIGTGMKQGEHLALRAEDLHIEGEEHPYVLVRFSAIDDGKDIPLVGGPRRAQLFGPSLAAAARWQTLLPKFAKQNPRGLLFPNPKGGARSQGKPIGGHQALSEALKKAGVQKHLRWADLRHTCGASLALGYWDRRYSLTEIQKALGQKSLPVTEGFYRTLVEAPAPALGEEPSPASRTKPTAPEEPSRHERHATTTGRGAAPTARAVVPPAPRHWHDDHLDLPAEVVARMSAHLRLQDSTLSRIVAALCSGKHVLLVGPPGTGKTDLAHAVVGAAADVGYCSGAHLATASADWTTFDTIGGYAMQRDGELRFRPGALLRAIERYEWLIIDELNRSDVDRAFGEFMTVLSNKTSDTSYELEDGRCVRVGPDPTASHAVPRTFRVLATMNTWDKTSLFRLSFALQRRFAIVQVGAPAADAYGALVLEHGQSDGRDAPLGTEGLERVTSLVARLLPVRELGPAVILDLVRYMRRRVRDAAIGEAFAEGIMFFVMPQLDGLPQDATIAARRVLINSVQGFAPETAVDEVLARFRELFPHVT